VTVGRPDKLVALGDAVENAASNMSWPDWLSLDHSQKPPQTHIDESTLNRQWQGLMEEVHKEKAPTDAQIQNEETQLRQIENSVAANADMRKVFDDAIPQLHKRALSRHLSNTEVSRFYEQEGKLLLTHSSFVADRDRIMAATELMHQVADPVVTSQGMHDTCTMAGLEHKLTVQKPSVVAEMVTSLALNDKWVGHDGKTIAIDKESLSPKAEEQSFLPGDGDRSFASQLFQLGAMNDLMQHFDPRWRYLQHDEHWYRYLVGDAFGGTGELVVNPQGKSTGFADVTPNFFDTSGGPTSWATGEELTRLTGETYGIMQGAKYRYTNIPKHDMPAPGIDKDADVFYFATPQELENRLQQLKNSNGLPIMIAVAAEGLYRVRSGEKPSAGNEPDHIICIDDYTPAQGGKPAKVLLHNNWTQSFNDWTTVENFFPVVS
jgi:hypothetical protein